MIYLQKVERIAGIAIHAGFVVQMHPGRPPRCPHQAELLVKNHRLARLDEDFIQMRIARHQPKTMIDINGVAIFRHIPSRRHHTGGGGVDCGAARTWPGTADAAAAAATVKNSRRFSMRTILSSI